MHNPHPDQVVAIDFDESGNQYCMSFGELLQKNHVSIEELAKWCCVSRQMIYRYINGVVQPERLRYCLVMDIAQYLDENDVVVYNSLVESFERIHEYDEEKGEWI